MADTKFNSACNLSRENACIESSRVLDSCRDRDCFENVKVFLSDYGNDIIDRTTSIRVLESEVSFANISVDPFPFNRGFYSVSIRLYIKITFEACVACDKSRTFEGIAVVDKKACLYGGESNVKTFKSSVCESFCSPVPLCPSAGNLPTATVELVDPIILSVGVFEKEKACDCCCLCCSCDIPDAVYGRVDGGIIDASPSGRFLAVSIGLFSVVRITRTAQYLVSAKEYCVPDKECVVHEESDPCGIFKTMPFPAGEFCSAGCNDKKC